MYKRVLHVHATINLDNLAADIACHVRSEEETYVGDVLGLTAATERNLLHPVLANILRQLSCHSGLDEARSNSVGADALRSKLLSY